MFSLTERNFEEQKIRAEWASFELNRMQQSIMRVVSQAPGGGGGSGGGGGGGGGDGDGGGGGGGKNSKRGERRRAANLKRKPEEEFKRSVDPSLRQ